MNQKFSSYLKDIGLLDETASSSILNSDDKSSFKSFNDSSFDLLMNYFNNLDEEQKKFMCQNIPSNFILISEKIQKDKLKSLFIQTILRKKLILLRAFITWKLKAYLWDNEHHKDNSENFNSSKKMNLINIDNNEEPNSKEGKEFQNNKDSLTNEYNFRNLTNNKNLRNTYNSNNSENSNFKYINIYQNKNDSDKKTCNNSDNKIKSNNKYKTHSVSRQNKINKKIINRENNLNNNNFNTKTHLLSSLEEKEMIELEECFFRPKINKSRKINKKIKNENYKSNSQKDILNKKQHQQVFEKLYKYNDKYKLSKEIRTIELEKIEGKKITFIPETNLRKSNNKRNNNNKLLITNSNINNDNKNIKKNKNRVKSEENLNLNFIERQKNYLIKKRKHSVEIKNQLDSIYNEICSFNPKINTEKNKSHYNTNIKTNTKNNKDETVFKRLYQEGKKRLNNRAQKEQKNIENIIYMSNIINPEKNFDMNTINKLYENKKMKNNIIKIRKKVEEEEGTTFKPFISENPFTKNINGTFFERNQKLINDRETFYDEENKKIALNDKKNIIGKEYSKEERQKVIKNIINRLYNESSFIKKSIK